MSDERRRKRYDTTGNTSASFDIEDDDFNWADFFRVQFGDPQFKTKELDKFKSEYQGSDEEKRDVLAAHTKFSGDLNAVFNEIMFSNPLDDEERFRLYIDQAITAGETEAYHAYTHESPKKRAARHKAAAKEAREAGRLAEEMGVAGKEAKDGKKKGKKGGKNDGDNEVDLATLIQRNQKSRSSIIDQLEAKYGGGKTSKNGTKRKLEEPPEEMFEKNRKLKEDSRQTPRKNTRKGVVEVDEERAVDEDASADREEEERTKTKATRSSTRGKKGTATKIMK